MFRKRLVEESPQFQEEALKHDFVAGDHVLRWSRVLLCPIQIHGIVLAAGPGLVTIIDFGLSASHDQNHLEDVKEENVNRRMTIITLTEQEGVNKWKKVDYGKSLLSSGKWAKVLSLLKHKGVFKSNENYASIEGSKSNLKSQADDGNADCEKNVESSSIHYSKEKPNVAPPKEVFAQQRQEAELLASLLDEDDSLPSDDERENSLDLYENCKKGSFRDDGHNTTPLKSVHDPHLASLSPPSLPASDPSPIVLARVRFLLSDAGRSALPPHNIIYANSECIAVWCKTGRFSTIQSQIFLHSTALGNAKTATMVSLLVGAQTVTVTSSVPAAGFWGWLGYTTTTSCQVGLLSMNPWLIPILAGYGVVAVSAPYFILHNAQKKWKISSSHLNDAFWQRASHDVYVSAIRHWSGLR